MRFRVLPFLAVLRYFFVSLNLFCIIKHCCFMIFKHFDLSFLHFKSDITHVHEVWLFRFFEIWGAFNCQISSWSLLTCACFCKHVFFWFFALSSGEMDLTFTPWIWFTIQTCFDFYFLGKYTFLRWWHNPSLMFLVVMRHWSNQSHRFLLFNDCMRFHKILGQIIVNVFWVTVFKVKDVISHMHVFKNYSIFYFYLGKLISFLAFLDVFYFERLHKFLEIFQINWCRKDIWTLKN